MAPADRKEQFTDVSRQVNAGLGIEIPIGSKLAVQGEARYHRVLVGHVARFGAFGDQDLLGVQVGVTFYFGGRSAKKRAGDGTP